MPAWTTKPPPTSFDTPSPPPSSAAAPTSSSSLSCSATPDSTPSASTPDPQPKTKPKHSNCLNHPGFAGDSVSWEGWGHVEKIWELPEGAAGPCCSDGGGGSVGACFGVGGH